MGRDTGRANTMTGNGKPRKRYNLPTPPSVLAKRKKKAERAKKAGVNGTAKKETILPKIPGKLLLTHDLAAAIENLLAVQPNRQKVCKELGINSCTFYRWLELGEDDEANEVYRRFRASVEKAQIRWERGSLEAIVAATKARTSTRRRVIKKESKKGDDVTTTVETSEIPPDWRAAAWLLERRIPKVYGRRDKVEHSGNLGLATALTFLRGDLSDEDRERLPAPT